MKNCWTKNIAVLGGKAVEIPDAWDAGDVEDFYKDFVKYFVDNREVLAEMMVNNEKLLD